MWEIIDFEKKYFQEMIDMTKEYYGTENDISNNCFVEHEYFKNPAGGAFIKLAYDKENKCLAGQYIVIPRNCCVNGNVVACVLSLNTLTKADYRGQQVFVKLAEAVYMNCKDNDKFFCYGMPNQNSFHGFVTKLKFDEIGTIPLFLKIIHPFRMLGDKMHFCHYHDEQKKLSTKKVYKNLKCKIRIKEITKKNIKLCDVFWEKIKMKYPVLGIRDAEYIKWRYLDLPLRDYGIYMAVQNGIPCGYVIGRVTTVSDMRCGMIVDFLVKTGREDVGCLLLDYMIDEFKNQRVGLLGCLMQEKSEEAGYLKKKGFFVCPKKLLPQPFPLIFRQFHNLPKTTEQELRDFSNWFFTMGDYDVI